MSITAAEIARMCNVSRTTVDRALKNKAGISESTRRRICEVAEKYDYRPNYLASSLSTGRTKAVGIIVFDLYNQHFSYMVGAVERYFARRGVFTYICLSEKDPQRERALVDNLIDRQVDGILLVPINDSPAFIDHLRSLQIPIVAASNRLDGFPFVGGDNAAAVYQGMESFYQQGYRTVHFICPPLRRKGEENLFAQEERANGYLRFKRDHRDMRGELITDANYLECVEALLDGPEKPGVFCSSDLFTLNIRKRIIDRGWQVTEKCALMGFDGLEFLEHLSQRPPSVFYPAEEIGEASAKMLDDMIHGRPTEREVLLPCPLLPGAGEFANAQCMRPCG